MKKEREYTKKKKREKKRREKKKKREKKRRDTKKVRIKKETERDGKKVLEEQTRSERMKKSWVQTNYTYIVAWLLLAEARLALKSILL